MKINIHEQISEWRKVMAETHEVPLVKKAMMKAAGALLSSPALYRAALPPADSALRQLPHFILYNRLNMWGRGREAAAGAEADVPPVVQGKPRERRQ